MGIAAGATFSSGCGGEFAGKFGVRAEQAQQAEHAAGRGEAPLLPVAQGGGGGSDAAGELRLRQPKLGAGAAQQDLLRGADTRAGIGAAFGFGKRLTDVGQRLAHVGFDGGGDFFNVKVAFHGVRPFCLRMVEAGAGKWAVQ